MHCIPYGLRDDGVGGTVLMSTYGLCENADGKLLKTEEELRKEEAELLQKEIELSKIVVTERTDSEGLFS